STIMFGTVPTPIDVRADLPPQLDLIILKAMSRLQADRYQTAADLGAALEQFGVEGGQAASTMALAGFMKQLFGEPKEPWVDGDTPKPVARPNFDGDLPGLALPTGAEKPRQRLTPPPKSVRLETDAPTSVGKTPFEKDTDPVGEPTVERSEAQT